MDDDDLFDIRIDDHEPWPPWYAWFFWGVVIEIGAVILVLSIFSK